MKTYNEVLDYLFSALPMYQRVGAAAYKTDITNTVRLLGALDNPHEKFRSIHVAGTNGKGSVSHMLASILQQAGYRVGLYTSPHLTDFRERIRINGTMIPEQDVCSFVERHQTLLDEVQPSFFEMTVALAFEYFAQQQVDVAVVEVGMGGRLDSTNVITPDISIITNIGLDHTQFLGDTIPKIAAEKAGIIKRQVPVVVGESQPETMDVFLTKAAYNDTVIYFADSNYSVSNVRYDGNYMILDISYSFGKMAYSGIKTPLCGEYQKKNLLTVMQAVYLLPKLGYKITDSDVYDGIANVIANTGFRGRWQVMDNNPLTVCETAHNKDGIQSMLGTLSGMTFSNLHIIYGCVNDKDYASILALLPSYATYYFCKPDVPRGLDVDTLYAAAQHSGLQGKAYPDIASVVQAARKNADEKSLILITGSIFLVADALKYFSAS